MKKLLLAISFILPSINVYSYDKLNSHEQFETGPMPTIINYDPEFRPPMPMPQYKPAPLPDDELYQSDAAYDIQIIRKDAQ